MPNYITPAIDRFMSKVERIPGVDCWIWTGSVIRGGYGSFPVYVRRGTPMKIAKAHRFAFAHFRGEVPQELDVLHRCDVPCCVNPEHLFLGTQGDNNRDRDRKGRHRALKGQDNGNAVLNPELVRMIRTSRESINKMAKRLGVSYHCVRAARVGLTWRHVDANSQ